MLGQSISTGYLQRYRDMTADEARSVVRGLDGAEIVPLYKESGGEYSPLENIHGLRNTATGKVTMSVSGRYHPLTHEEGFMPVLDAIEHAGIDRNMKMWVGDHRDSAELYILFPDLVFNEDRDGGTMMYGLRFMNRYDVKTSFKGQVFCWRLACANGSTHGELGELSISAYHVESHIQNLEGEISGFITKMLSSVTYLDSIIDTAIESQIEFPDYTSLAQTLGEVTGSARRGVAVADMLPLETNRWQVYNAITEHASHAPKMSWKTRDRLLDVAERRVLMADSLIPVMIATAE